MSALGGHVVSMTREPSDLLTVLWLWKWSEQTDGGDPRDAELRLPVVPLFETIGDLERARRHPLRRCSTIRRTANGSRRSTTGRS